MLYLYLQIQNDWSRGLTAQPADMIHSYVMSYDYDLTCLGSCLIWKLVTLNPLNNQKNHNILSYLILSVWVALLAWWFFWRWFSWSVDSPLCSRPDGKYLNKNVMFCHEALWRYFCFPDDKWSFQLSSTTSRLAMVSFSECL